jgi:mono/diheme cytochrome c family protein
MLKTVWFHATWAVVPALFGSPLLLSAADPNPDLFETRVRPLLAKNCYGCHAASAMGGLRLDSQAGLLKGGRSGPAVVLGEPEKSLLIKAIRYDDIRLKMPPAGKLPDGEIAALAEWIKEGAVWPESPADFEARAQYIISAEQRRFWSFQPVRKPAVPAVKNTGWPINDIDRFILAKLERDGLKTVRPASRRVWIRRAYLDMIGLPPTPEEVDAFERDQAPDAFAKVVDHLLASPHYGERWGRYWLDLARYSDGMIGDVRDVPLPNAYRYRDWVVQALNQDMPYDLFLKAQFVADLLDRPDRDKLAAGLGFHALAPTEVAGVPADDRVDVTGRAILGLTIACAQCHDHKYDPIPTQDYYSLLGVFRSSKVSEWPLVPAIEVKEYQDRKKQIDALQAKIDEFVDEQSKALTSVLFEQTANYLVASWKVLEGGKTASAAVSEEQVDSETLQRWIAYLTDPNKEHPFLEWWYDLRRNHAPLDRVRTEAAKFQELAIRVQNERKDIDDRNYVKLGGKAGEKNSKLLQFSNLEFLPADKGYLWRDLASPPFTNVGDGFRYNGGIYYYGKPLRRGADGGSSNTRDREDQIDRWLQGVWRDHLESMRAELARLQKDLPPKYPFLHVLLDSDKPADMNVWVRGEMTNQGEVAPRRFLRILSDGDPKPFVKGSGRLELAERIASPTNPLTPRVIVNRLWLGHFGRGIVGTPSNFGLLGERPTNPDLLDYLASTFMEQGWSLKKLHRQILLSSTYALSSENDAANAEKDPDNTNLWRANIRKRLDFEALRDSILAVAGALDARLGGAPVPLDENNRRRTIYGTVSRTHPDPTMALFDFPNPNSMSEERLVTVGPLQRLWFMNSPFVMKQSKLFAERLEREAGDDKARIDRAYRLLYGRAPTNAERQTGLDYLRGEDAWAEYAQALLSSTEFQSVN